MTLRIAVDYSAQWSLMQAGQVTREHVAIDPTEFGRALATVNHSVPVSDVDLLIRTGGEQRMSDFLLWECAYAELYFTSRMWPDFDAADFDIALSEYANRDRRFGRIVPDNARRIQNG
jgi:undecaprenyl diphosphate synthase